MTEDGSGSLRDAFAAWMRSLSIQSSWGRVRTGTAEVEVREQLLRFPDLSAPEELVEWFTIHDGIESLDPARAAPGVLPTNWSLLSLREAVDAAETDRATAGDDPEIAQWFEGFIPILSTDSGWLEIDASRGRQTPRLRVRWVDSAGGAAVDADLKDLCAFGRFAAENELPRWWSTADLDAAGVHGLSRDLYLLLLG